MVEQFKQRRGYNFFGGNYFGQCTHDGSPNSDSILKKRNMCFWKIFGTGRTVTAIGELHPLLFLGMPATPRYLPSGEVLGTIESGVDFVRKHSRHRPAVLHARGNRRCVHHPAGREGRWHPHVHGRHAPYTLRTLRRGRAHSRSSTSFSSQSRNWKSSSAASTRKCSRPRMRSWRRATR